MQRHIDELSGHHIVCGLGDTGRHAVAELQKTMTPHVVVDLSEENIKKLKGCIPKLWAKCSSSSATLPRKTFWRKPA